MKLHSFRVQNYKKIRDTGWVTCKDLTVFVGKNESGKSAIFRGLSKINPSDNENYDGLKEFPRRRYTDEFKQKDWPVASAKFQLTDTDKVEVGKILPSFSECDLVEVTRFYSGKKEFSSDLKEHFKPIIRSDFQKTIDSAIDQIQSLTATKSKSETLKSTKETLIPLLENVKKVLTTENVNLGQYNQVISIFMNNLNETWLKEQFNEILRPFSQIKEAISSFEKVSELDKWVEVNLPKFVYFDKYDVIDSSIHIPTFSNQIKTTPHAPRIRATLCLFKQVGLDLDAIGALGRHQPGHQLDANIQRQIDERMIQASSASNAMTSKFSNWWDQRKHIFHYKFDGDYFRIWVSDDLDPSEIELDQRSGGMQYFFSFFVVFLVEAAEKHANSILLLDEPGLQLHGTAQQKIIEFLEKLSNDNQVLYSTHSPFMIEASHLERARAVYEDEEGTTKVSEDIWPRDKDSLFPLQAALGYQLAQSLFISKRQLVVEGITDQWVLNSVNYALQNKNKTTIRPDLVILPSAGLSKLLPLTSMLLANQIDVVALLDGDEPGRKEGKKLVDKLLSGEDRKCLFIGDFSDNSNAELEDLFPEAQYVECVKVAYPGIDLKFNQNEMQIQGVINKIETYFKRENIGRFEKWKVAAILRDKIIESPDYLSNPTLERFEEIFSAINSLFPN